MRISDWSSDVCSSDLTRRAADARDEHRLGRIGADLGQRPLDGLEDRVIAAPWAPADLLIRFPVLDRGLDGGHFVHSSSPRHASKAGNFPARSTRLRGVTHQVASAASLAASISGLRTGWPK